MGRIIIELEGGLVHAVWSTDTSIEVKVMDRDIPENDEDARDYAREIKRLETEIRDLNMTDIS